MVSPAIVMLVAFVASTTPAKPGELPRYRLEVGQELTFSAENQLERLQAMSKHETVTWTVWVIGKAGQDGWKLIVRRDYFARYTDPKRAGVTLDHSEVNLVELGSDGRLLSDSTLDFTQLRSFLPVLPRDQGQVQKGYEERCEAQDDALRYRVVNRDGDTWEIEAVGQGLSSEIYEIDSRTTFSFDPARGLPVLATIKSEQKSLLKCKLEGTLRLKGVKDHGAAWAGQASADAERYFAARQLLRAANKDGKPDSMMKAQQALLSVQGQAKMDLFQKHLATDLKNLERAIKDGEQSASEARFLGKSVAWTTTDLDGKPVKLADFKGKVLVLDYWYRGCFWCVRSMPQLNELAEHYKGKPVAILGMNIDEDDADAHFVIKKMGLKYPTIRAGSTRKDYGVSAFPTILILDDKGVGCDLHIGYAPDLKELLIKKIDGLLKEQK